MEPSDLNSIGLRMKISRLISKILIFGVVPAICLFEVSTSMAIAQLTYPKTQQDAHKTSKEQLAPLRCEQTTGLLAVAHGSNAKIRQGSGSFVHRWTAPDGIPFIILDRNVKDPSSSERRRIEQLSSVQEGQLQSRMTALRNCSIDCLRGQMQKDESEKSESSPLQSVRSLRERVIRMQKLHAELESSDLVNPSLKGSSHSQAEAADLDRSLREMQATASKVMAAEEQMKLLSHSRN